MQAQETLQCPLCKDNISLSLIETHEEKCYVLLKQKKVHRLRPAHATAQTIPCNQCGSNIPFDLFNFHVGECVGNQMKQCEKCGIVFPQSIFLQHIQNCHFQYPEEFENDPFQLNVQIEMDNFHIDEKVKPKGLTKIELGRLQNTTLSKEQQCSICQAKMKKMYTAVSLGCGHKFHKNCVVPWLKENPKCPMCRTHALTVMKKKK